jgi:hypothetical protein
MRSAEAFGGTPERLLFLDILASPISGHSLSNPSIPPPRSPNPVAKLFANRCFPNPALDFCPSPTQSAESLPSIFAEPYRVESPICRRRHAPIRARLEPYNNLAIFHAT